jgi:hypothetical protein
VTIFTHILATTLGVQVGHLHGSDVALAYAFGVAVDADHALKAPYYLRTGGFERRIGYYWRSSLQEPVAFLWVVPLALALHTVVPVVFLALHIAMDYSVRYEKMPLYPYSRWVTRGWLVSVPDGVKEAALAAVLLCLNVLVFLKRS